MTNHSLVYPHSYSNWLTNEEYTGDLWHISVPVDTKWNTILKL